MPFCLVVVLFSSTGIEPDPDATALFNVRTFLVEMLNAEEWLPYCANAKKVAIAVILVEWVFIFSILLSFLFLLQNK